MYEDKSRKIMGSRCDRKKMDVEGDRLSALSDDLICKIFSFIDIKHAIQTSVLSSRWRRIWTSMCCLNFSCGNFCTVTEFFKFVTYVMSGRNNQIEVSSVRLAVHGDHSQMFIKSILDIILNRESSRNIQRLNITTSWDVKESEFALPLFSSRSLKHLTMVGCNFKHPIMTKPTFELPNLTTLNLHRVIFYGDGTTDNFSGLFSSFENLKNLTLNECNMMGGLNRLNIRHSGLSNLTLEGGCQGVNVVTPKLKNLTIRYWRNMFTIFAPNLASLHYKAKFCALELSANLPHLEKADIRISHPFQNKANAHEIVYMLQQLCSVKFLTLNLEIIKLLSSYSVLISRQHSPFANLKSLHIYPANDIELEETQPKVAMSIKVKSYLLNASPDATFTMVSHEEMSARNLMRELRVLLIQWKENSEANTTDMKQDKAPMPKQVEVENQLNTNMDCHFWERIAYTNEQFNNNIRRTVLKLRKIEEVLAKLPPTSYRAKLQVTFSSLCAEAEASMYVMLNHLKILYDKKPSQDYFHELATTSQLSS